MNVHWQHSVAMFDLTFATTAPNWPLMDTDESFSLDVLQEKRTVLHFLRESNERIPHTFHVLLLIHSLEAAVAFSVTFSTNKSPVWSSIWTIKPRRNPRLNTIRRYWIRFSTHVNDKPSFIFVPLITVHDVVRWNSPWRTVSLLSWPVGEYIARSFTHPLYLLDGHIPSFSTVTIAVEEIGQTP